MKIAVIGSGYVGLVTAACFAQSGNTVICRDIDEQKIKRLQNGHIPIFEAGLEELVETNLRNGRLIFTIDIREAVESSDYIFIAVGTPEKEDGSADLRYVVKVAEEIGACLNGFKVVINKSTVPVGTGSLVKKTIVETAEKLGLKHEVAVVSNPEFLREGSAVQDFLYPDRIVIGTDEGKPNDMMRELYFPFAKDESQIISMDLTSAELTKYAANCFLATKISFINEIANLCDKTGANIDEVKRGIGSDKRIGYEFLNPGIGYGGSCFPKDVKALIHSADQYKSESKILSSVDLVNVERRRLFFDKIMDVFQNDISGRHFGVWGLAFKPRTDDMREAPSIDIINMLLEKSAKVSANDPAVGKEVCESIWGGRVSYNENKMAVANKADALLILTEWDEYLNPDFQALKQAMSKPLIIDGRNIYNLGLMKQRGFSYHSMGRPTISAS